MPRWLKGSAMTRPTRSARRLRTIRVRSSPRCSMKDILLSSTASTMSPLPARHEVPEGAHTAAGLEPLADRRGDIGLRLPEGGSHPPAAGQPRGEPPRLPPVPEDVRRRFFQVAALHEDVLRPQPEDAPGGFLHVALGRDGHAGERGRTAA